MKFFHHEPDSKEGFEQKVEQEFNVWFADQNLRIRSLWPSHVDCYLNKLGSMTACRITFWYLHTNGNFE
jgi:hypothetical protein